MRRTEAGCGVPVRVRQRKRWVSVRRGWSRFWRAFPTFVKDFFSPLATIAIAALVAYYGHQFDERQAKAQETEASLKIVSTFSEMLRQIDEKDEPRKELAVIGIAHFGDDALPLLRLALAAQEQKIHDGAKAALYEIFRSETVSRKKVIEFLLDQLRSSRPELRTGALEVFSDIGGELGTFTAGVISAVKDLLRVTDGSLRETDETVLINAARFLSNYHTLDSENLLLDIAEKARSSGARRQGFDELNKVANDVDPCRALSRLRSITDPNEENKDDLQKAINQIRYH